MDARSAELSPVDADGEAKGLLHLPAERRAILKFDAVVVPTITTFYLLSFLDRTNIGNARVAGLQQELGLSNTQYFTALTITFVPYILMEIPGNLLIKRIGPRIYIPSLVMLWGLVSMLQGFVKSYAGLIAVRLFLGLCEGAVQPGMVLYMSMFYRRRQLQTRLSIFYTATSLAGAFSGLLAAAILNMDGLAGLHGWSWLFILEGLFTIVVGATATAYLPTSPQTAHFLTTEERAAVMHMLENEGMSEDQAEGFRWRAVGNAFKAPTLWLLGPLFFFNGTTVFGLAFFAPSIVGALGNSAIRTQLLTVPPYAVSFVSSVVGGLLCDRYGRRGLGIIIYSLCSLVGYAMVLGSTKPHVRYAALFFQTIGGFGIPGANTTWIANNMSPYYKRATGIAATLILSAAGGILSTWIFTDPPEYHRPARIEIAFIVGQLVVTQANIVYLSRQNKARAALRDQLRDSAKKDSEKGSENDSRSTAQIVALGDLHPDFVYTL